MSSSRNKRRIIQKSYENLVLEVDALDEISVGTVELSDNSVLDNLLPDNTTVYNDGAQYSYGLEKEAINSFIDDLLKLLSANIPGGNLPESYKTLMKTPTKYKIDLIDGGQYYHFGLERQLQRLSKIAGFTDNFETIELKIGIDGLPISRSSKKQFWPILASGDILNNGKPFLVGLYFSLFCKPEKSDQLLGPLVEELTLLLGNGVEINGLVRKISIKCIVADAPARNFVKNCVAFNGYYGCDRCTQKGQWLGRVVFSELDAPLRNDQDFRRNMYHNHQVKESILSKLEIGMVSWFTYIALCSNKFFTNDGIPFLNLAETNLTEGLDQNCSKFVGEHSTGNEGALTYCSIKEYATSTTSPAKKSFDPSRMTKSNVPHLILLYFTLNLSLLIGPTIALSGIQKLTCAITPHASCRYHLVFNNISTSDLPTTRNVPLTLTKRTFSHDLSPSSYQTTPQLDILRNKGWICEIVILFVTINPPNLTKFHPEALGYWILAHSTGHLRVPILRNFACHTLSSSGVRIPLGYPTPSEYNWLDYTFVSRNPELSEILIVTALHKLNATRHFKSGDFSCHSVLMEACFYPTLRIRATVFMGIQDKIVTTNFIGFSFFSCYMGLNGLTFSLYLAPYDRIVWIGMVIMLILSSSLLSLGFYTLNQKIYPMKLLLHFFGCLIDEVSNLPRKLSTLVSFRLISIPWLFVGVVMSSCYLSSFITNLNSPIPGERFDTYEKISCLSKPQISMDHYLTDIQKLDSKRILEDSKKSNFTNLDYSRHVGGFCYTVLSQFDRILIGKHYLLNFKFSQHFNYYIIDTASRFPPYLKRLTYSMLNPRIRWYPEKLEVLANVTAKGVNGIIEEELLKCDKSAYMAPSSEVDTYFEYLKRNYPTKSDSGIYNRELNRVRANATLSRKIEVKLTKFRYATEVKAVQLGDSIQTIFILHGICLAVSLCLAVLEYLAGNGRIIVKRVALSLVGFKKIMRSKKMQENMVSSATYLMGCRSYACTSHTSIYETVNISVLHTLPERWYIDRKKEEKMYSCDRGR
ncbi:hypothetical protein Fcan01_20938 [Folsomia candida]|uniref:Uncharacterized protein n=1 Tax=Folsomia candida TaxID=158441 RepID=A0A226DFD9_FOLCA|nr:hypothetical protein Fcan01_20938 [Folsomia candida]